MFKVKLDEITFNTDESVSIKDSNIVVFVGANNCGKTRTLGEIYVKSSNPNQGTIVVKRVKAVIDGTYNEALSWFEEFHSVDRQHVRTPQGNLAKEFIRLLFESDPNSNVEQLDTKLLSIICYMVGASDRLERTNGIEAIDFHKKPLTRPLHLLQAEAKFMKIIADATLDAFGIEISVDMRTDGKIYLRKGLEPSYENQLSKEYREGQEKQPRIDNEGDGIKAFIGCLLSTITGQYKILFIDEPELYLHPPQARRLGKHLALSALRNDQQVIIATHSSSFIQGILSITDKVSIIRIERDGDRNSPYPLGTEQLKQFWHTPLIKSPRTIMGLFYEGVVIVEGESDVQFYESLMTRLDENNKLGRPADYGFIGVGGVHTIKIIAPFYKSLSIPVVAVADFDLLLRPKDLKTTFEAMGGNFSLIKDLYNNVLEKLRTINGISENKHFEEEISSLEAKQKINRVLDSIKPNQLLLPSEYDEVAGLLKSITNRTNKVKYEGINVFEEFSEDKKTCQALIDEFKRFGLFIVYKGEVESWDSILAGRNNKALWIQKALEMIATVPTSFSTAENFVQEIASHLSNRANSLKFQHDSKKQNS